MNEINIGLPINLPVLLDTRLLVQAGSGGGKSYLLRKLIESIGNKVQTIILDPEGEFVTLREKFDFILIGKGGDIPLNLKYAETLAHKLLETGVSAIIDLYELKQYERILFVKLFLNALMSAKKELWHSALIVVDEAHMFCPEGSPSESAAAVTDLCTRGRKRGFCAVLATQRLSKLKKDAAAECLNKLIGRTGLDIDRKRAGEELGFTSKTDLLELRDLVPGQFHAFGPAISNQVVKFKCSKVITTHPEAGKRITSIPPTPDAIKKIMSKLADIPEEAEKELETKASLQEEIVRLKKENMRLQRISTPPAADISAQVKQLATHAAELGKMQSEISRYAKAFADLRKAILEFDSAKEQLIKPSSKTYGEIYNPELNKSSVHLDTHVVKIQNLPTKIPAATSSDEKLGKCARAILHLLISYPEWQFSRAHLAVGALYSPTSSGFQNAISELNTRGLLIRIDGRIALNPESNYRQFIDRELARDAKFSIRSFMQQKLGKCERELLDVLLDAPFETFSRVQLAARTPSEYSITSSGFHNAISSLNTLELIVKEGVNIKLNPVLMQIDSIQ